MGMTFSYMYICRPKQMSYCLQTKAHVVMLNTFTLINVVGFSRGHKLVLYQISLEFALNSLLCVPWTPSPLKIWPNVELLRKMKLYPYCCVPCNWKSLLYSPAKNVILNTGVDCQIHLPILRRISASRLVCRLTQTCEMFTAVVKTLKALSHRSTESFSVLK